MNEKLRTAKIGGVKGKLGEVCSHGRNTDSIDRAAIFNDWAIRHAFVDEVTRSFTVIHVHTGYAAWINIPSQDKARAAIKFLLKTKRFKTMRATKTIAQVCKVFLDWKKVQ